MVLYYRILERVVGYVIKMVTLDKAIIARIEKQGKHFEILVDSELAYDLKDGKSVSLAKMLAINEVFSDSKKGLKISATELERVFGTSDIEQVAETIVKEGDVQLTTDFRRQKVEEKKNQIAAFISRYAINPQTKTPHPQERILNAMHQAHINIDPFKPAEQQVDEVLKSIKPIIPISLEEATIYIVIPAKYSGHAYGQIKALGTMQGQQWLSDGSLSARLVVPAGLKENVYKILNSITGGEAKIEEKS